MFKFFENKLFFFFSTFCAILLSIIILILPDSSTQTTDPFAILARLFTILALIFLLLFFNNEHKELSKVMLTSILVIGLLYYSMNLFYVSYMIKSLPFIVKATQINSTDAISKVLPNTLFPIITNLVFLVITLLIYINHCCINFTNKTSFMGVNFNQILIMLFLIFVISNKIIQCFVLKTPISVHYILNGFDGFFILLSVVSTESFINKMREKRENKK